MSEPRTRLAPSPTGALHLGNARTFLINWVLAKQRGWRVVLRIEDLDTPRTKAEADRQAIEDLRWLQMSWDEGPYYQTEDLSPYHDALRRLAAAGLIYPCTATRKEVLAAASAPHDDVHELHYPGIHRPTHPTPFEFEPTQDGQTAYRLWVPDEMLSYTDEVVGAVAMNVQQQVGDFVVAAKSGLPAYQLAVVVDDARQGVTHVVRGDDLLRSTGRQLLLYEMLGLEPVPEYVHLPLVVGEDGRRLAKRHGDTRVAMYRQLGVPAERVIGLLASWSGCGERRAMSGAELVERFDLAKLPREPVTFTEDDHRWLIDD